MNPRALLVLLALSGTAFAQSTAPTAPVKPPVDASEPATKDDTAIQPEPLTVDEIRRFVSVFRAVQQAYVEPVSERKLMQSAIRGLLTDLDPHSAYLSKDDLSSLSEFASGAYGGLGLEVLQQPDRSLVVVAPIDDTPAARAGIRPGDIIIKIDGKPIEADSADGAVDSMRGDPGTSISLTLVREGESEPITVKLVREVIRVASVRSRLLEPGFGYLRVATFQSDTGAEVRKHVGQLAKKGPLRGLVIDLRSNPGGLLNAAVESADAFLEQGVIVSTRGRIASANSVYRASPGDLLDGAPIVLLTDAGTASAAEVLAGALHDHHRAVVMGSLSFGKGSVQNVLPLDNGEAIKLTTGRYYTPNGTSIQAEGIVPDVALAPDLVLRHGSDDQAPSVRESDLPGHLDNDAPAVQAASKADEIDDLAIREALNLLKGLAIYRQSQLPEMAD